MSGRLETVPVPAGQARSRAEALAMGKSLWFKPKRKPVRTLAMVERDLAATRKALGKRREEARLIQAGYLPPKPGDMFFVNPQCERACEECSFACRIFLDYVPITEKIERELVAERTKLRRKAKTGDNVVFLDDRREARR